MPLGEGRAGGERSRGATGRRSPDDVVGADAEGGDEGEETGADDEPREVLLLELGAVAVDGRHEPEGDEAADHRGDGEPRHFRSGLRTMLESVGEWVLNRDAQRDEARRAPEIQWTNLAD